MNEFLLVIFILIFFTYIGKIVIRVFGFLNDFSDLDTIPFSFALGSAVCAFQLYLYSRLNIHWVVLYVVTPWLLFFVAIFILKKELLIFRIRKFNKKLRLKDYVLIFFIFILIGFVGFESALRPLSAWDGWASWLFKSKMFYIDGSIKASSIQYSQSDYPLLVSLIGTFIYIVFGKVNDTAVLLYFFGCYTMLGIGLFTQLKRRIGTTNALLFTFLLLSLQNLIRHGGRFEAGYADIPLALYMFLSSALLYQFVKQKEIMTFILLQIFLGITALIKNEGLFFSILAELFVLYFIFKTKKTNLLPVMLFWITPIIDWNIFKYLYNVPQNFLLVNLQNHVHLDTFFSIIFEFSKEFINFQNWNILWIVFFFSLTYSLFKRKTSIFYIFVLVQLLLYIIVFMISPIDPVVHVKNIVDRLFIHVAPLAVFAVALTHYDKG
ncbi:MAG: hypothetical protein A3F31_01950 [Candidatus Levybacteria bacterium RIFCSPHIGHO2_12_FULL_38_12]|nr:MAG: hypothetical protein A2770_00835 [Candidatus Levybacteria bacterium RIFCSPHIGHO2_01_FULL_38_12]OGH22440.1 MAG: hypothetical protein A3D75_00155 [Candidatus Levybacteria bacterium RIFCSPHIGHO2_02_FULL_37_18]OGH23405.1 MAG: hypothetical protein A3F31_01950 [Candidatus Levybacteria bacterium RIFCSPHIGHO2_12_FULL_38_12]OGH34914.1 MAG: hypothetical protein A3A47_00530 [Candidatus Levybacteria bacterium RIFCSPLOWO2_01_FULL_37_20]OGH43656.1 MAG: hypothetical protein A3J14_02925 [Candidatus Lev